MKSKGEQKIWDLIKNLPKVSQEYVCGAKGFFQKELRYDFHGFYKKKEFLIEFQGIEHYKFIPFFHRSRADFQKRQIYDEKKISHALAIGVNLYCIPYWEIDNINSLENLFNKKYLARTKNHNYITYEKYQKSLTST